VNNVNVSGGKKTRETIKTSKEDVEKNCGSKVREKDKKHHTWKIFQIDPLKTKNKGTHKAS